MDIDSYTALGLFTRREVLLRGEVGKSISPKALAQLEKELRDKQYEFQERQAIAKNASAEVQQIDNVLTNMGYNVDAYDRDKEQGVKRELSDYMVNVVATEPAPQPVPNGGFPSPYPQQPMQQEVAPPSVQPVPAPVQDVPVIPASEVGGGNAGFVPQPEQDQPLPTYQANSHPAAPQMNDYPPEYYGVNSPNPTSPIPDASSQGMLNGRPVGGYSKQELERVEDAPNMLFPDDR